MNSAIFSAVFSLSLLSSAACQFAAAGPFFGRYYAPAGKAIIAPALAVPPPPPAFAAPVGPIGPVAPAFAPAFAPAAPFLRPALAPIPVGPAAFAPPAYFIGSNKAKKN